MGTTTGSSTASGGGRPPRHRRRGGRPRHPAERHPAGRSRRRRFGAALIGAGTLLLSVPALGGTATATADPRPSPVANPDLAVGCGLDVSLVLDRSGSITAAGAQATVTQAGQTFVDGLEGTGSRVKVVSFGSDAGQDSADRGASGLGHIVYRPPSTVTVDQPDLGPATNWDDALEVVRRTATPAGSDQEGGDLVVMVTDGNPTARNEAVGSGSTPGDGHEGRTTEDGSGLEASEVEIDEAIREANWLKTDGSHLFVVAVTDNVGVDDIRAITDGSASQEYSGEPGTFGRADFTEVDAYEDLAALMRRLATDACTLRVDKLADTDPATEGTQTDPAPAGAVVRYEVAIANPTPQEVTVLALRDVWGADPGGAPVTIADLDCGDPATPPFTIAPGGSRACAFSAALPADAIGSVSDHVGIDWRLASDDADADPRTAGDTATVPIAPPLGVRVSKTASPTALEAPGGDVTYTVVIENTSVVPVTITELVDHEGADTTGPTIPGLDATRCDATSLAPADGIPDAGSDTTTCRATVPTGERSAGTVVQDTVAVTVTEDGGSRTATAADSATVTITAVPPTTRPGAASEPAPEPEVLPHVVTTEPVLTSEPAAAVAPPRAPSASPRPAQRLAVTGSTSGLLARAGAVLIAAGALAVIVGSRRELLFDV